LSVAVLLEYTKFNLRAAKFNTAKMIELFFPPSLLPQKLFLNLTEHKAEMENRIFSLSTP